MIKKFYFCWLFDAFSSYVKTLLSLIVPHFQDYCGLLYVVTLSNHCDVTRSRVHQFLWYYLRLPLMSVFADYHLSSVFYWFEWVVLFFNSLTPGKFEWNFRYVILKQILVILRHGLWNCPNVNITGIYWWPVIIGSGNGLVPSGNKPLPEPMLTYISVTIWCH